MEEHDNTGPGAIAGFEDWLKSGGFVEQSDDHVFHNWMFPANRWGLQVRVAVNVRDGDFRVRLESWALNEHLAPCGAGYLDTVAYSVTGAKKLVEQARVKYDELQDAFDEAVGSAA